MLMCIFSVGSLKWGETTWAWRAPCLFQVVAPAIVLAFLFIIPESPRVSLRGGKYPNLADDCSG